MKEARGNKQYVLYDSQYMNHIFYMKCPVKGNLWRQKAGQRLSAVEADCR